MKDQECREREIQGCCFAIGCRHEKRMMMTRRGMGMRSRDLKGRK